MKNVQIRVSHGVMVNQLAAAGLQLQAVSCDIQSKDGAGFSWEEIPTNDCAFTSQDAVVRLDHFSLIAIIVSKIEAGFGLLQEFFRAFSITNPSKSVPDYENIDKGQEDTLVSIRIEGPSSPSIPPSLHLSYAAVVLGPSQGDYREGCRYWNVYVYCYYNVRDNMKVSTEPVKLDIEQVYIPLCSAANPKAGTAAQASQ